MPNKTNIPSEKPFKENRANAHRFGFNGMEMDKELINSKKVVTRLSFGKINNHLVRLLPQY
jgi:hypothetical protein